MHSHNPKMRDNPQFGLVEVIERNVGRYMVLDGYVLKVVRVSRIDASQCFLEYQNKIREQSSRRFETRIRRGYYIPEGGEIIDVDKPLEYRTYSDEKNAEMEKDFSKKPKR